MADRDDRTNDRGGEDSEEDLQRALDRGPRPDLVGDMEENRNLDGSTTWETLPDEQEPRGTADEERRGGG
jgi:hypothetical protein